MKPNFIHKPSCGKACTPYGQTLTSFQANHERPVAQIQMFFSTPNSEKFIRCCIIGVYLQIIFFCIPVLAQGLDSGAARIANLACEQAAERFAIDADKRRELIDSIRERTKSVAEYKAAILEIYNNHEDILFKEETEMRKRLEIGYSTIYGPLNVAYASLFATVWRNVGRDAFTLALLGEHRSEERYRRVLTDNCRKRISS